MLSTSTCGNQDDAGVFGLKLEGKVSGDEDRGKALFDVYLHFCLHFLLPEITGQSNDRQ